MVYRIILIYFTVPLEHNIMYSEAEVNGKLPYHRKEVLLNKQQIIDRLHMIYTDEYIRRLRITVNKRGISITTDVHGLTVKEARRFINNIITILDIPITLIIIHGYRHGHAIKEMIMDDFTNSKVICKIPDPQNKGVTNLAVA